ncbi:hypothetical protein [Corynebacterium glutamicum]|nr:hypothetical protein [Corynebacterium glutamicum]
MSVDMVLFVTYGADQDLLKEDLVEKTLLAVRCFEVGGVAIGGEAKRSF